MKKDSCPFNMFKELVTQPGAFMSSLDKTWNISNAFPIKWTGPQLKTSENSIAIQSLELAGGEITIIPGLG